MQAESPLPVNELKDKSSGYDDISFNVVRNCFGPLLKPLMHVFNLPIERGIFPDDLKNCSSYSNI